MKIKEFLSAFNALANVPIFYDNSKLSCAEKYMIKKMFGYVAYRIIEAMQCDYRQVDSMDIFNFAIASAILGASHETKKLIVYFAFLEMMNRNKFIEQCVSGDDFSEAIQMDAGCNLYLNDVMKAKTIQSEIMNNDRVYESFLVDNLDRIFFNAFGISVVSSELSSFNVEFSKMANYLEQVSEHKMMPKKLSHLKIAGLIKEFKASVSDQKDFEAYKRNGIKANFERSQQTTVNDSPLPKANTGRQTGQKINNETKELLYDFWVKNGCQGSGQFEATMKRKLDKTEVVDGLVLVFDDDLPFTSRNEAKGYRAEFSKKEMLFSGLATVLTDFKKRFKQ